MQFSVPGMSSDAILTNGMHAFRDEV